MQTIAVDIDDVLTHNTKHFIAYSNQQWGTRLTVDDYDEDWGKLWQVDPQERERRADQFHASGSVSNYEPIEGALEALKILRQTYQLVIITSRQTSIKDETLAWLNVHYANVFKDVHFAGIYDVITDASLTATKADIAIRLKADYLIDDQPKHCLAAAQVGIKALLFGDYSWNRDIGPTSNVIRVNDWPAVLEYFDAQRR